MTGLVLKIAPFERFIVNGAVLENGEKPARIRVVDGAARVLRCRDALRPEDVTTPVCRVYYAVQLIITGDLQEAQVIPALSRAVDELEDPFSHIDPDRIPMLRSMLSKGNYYSALYHLRGMMAAEAALLAMHPAQDASPAMQAA